MLFKSLVSLRKFSLSAKLVFGILAVLIIGTIITIQFLSQKTSYRGKAAVSNEGAGSQSRRDALLAKRGGFGQGATGGYLGETTHVTTNADSGPGSLRDAVSGNTPRWIVFDGDYTISLNSALTLGSNKTIDGRSRRVTITAPNKAGIIIDTQSNIIIHNLLLYNFGDFRLRQNDNPHDAILINASSNIWIDHNDLSQAGDKLIGIHGGSRDITVSWNHFFDTPEQVAFSDHPQVFQIGTQTTQDQDINQTVTINHNFFEFSNNSYRHPVISYGKAHAYNNYLKHWGAYGMKSQRVGQLYAEANIFEAGTDPSATLFDASGDGCSNSGLCDNRDGYVKAVNNLKYGPNPSTIRQNQPELVFDPSSIYSYTAESANETLRQKILSLSGWQNDSVSVTPAVTPITSATHSPSTAPSPTSQVVPTLTSSPATTIFLKVFLHGIGLGGDNANPQSLGNQNPLRSTRPATVEIYNSQNQLVLTKTAYVTFNKTNGNFTGTLDLGSAFLSGAYSIKVQITQFLRARVPGIQTITQNAQNTLPSVSLIAGDTNTDNKLDIIDYSTLLDCFSDIAPPKNCSDSSKKLSADLTDDGQVNQFDYNLFLRELTNIVGE